MSSISIIGLGNMASALAGRALAGGNAVEIIGRDPAKAKDVAGALGGATVGTAAPPRPGTSSSSPCRTPARRRVSSTGTHWRQGHRRHHQPRHPGKGLSPPRAVPARRRSPRPPRRRHVVKAFNTCSPAFWRRLRGSPAGCVHRRRRRAGKGKVSIHREPGTAPDGRRQLPWRGTGERCPAAAGPRPLRQAHQLLPRRQHSQLSAPAHHSRAKSYDQKRTVTCTFSSLAGPAMPVRTSSPSSSPPGTRSPAWPGRTRPRRPCPR